MCEFVNLGLFGRIHEGIDCLNGFSDKVSIQISTNEEISNIIIVLQNKIKDVDELKKAIEGFIDADDHTPEYDEAWDNNYEWAMTIAENINDKLHEEE